MLATPLLKKHCSREVLNRVSFTGIIESIQSWSYKGSRMNRKKRIPFGKHRGKVISELPIQYLLWLYNTVDLDRWGIRTAVQEALGLADEEEDDDYCPDMGETEEQLEFHPDRGGDRDMMSLINELLNWK
jgi:hypothetical protein